MFNLQDFIFNNLISGYKNGSFTKEQVSIYSVNYMTKGLFTETDVEKLNEILSEEPAEDTADSVMDEESNAEITAEETSDSTVEYANETTTCTNDSESRDAETE